MGVGVERTSALLSARTLQDIDLFSNCQVNFSITKEKKILPLLLYSMTQTGRERVEELLEALLVL